MKKHEKRKYFLFIPVLLLWLYGFKSKDDPVPINSFNYLSKHFVNPDKQCGSEPLWVWHTKVTKTVIDLMMLDFKKNQFGGVIVHPARGLSRNIYRRNGMTFLLMPLKKERNWALMFGYMMKIPIPQGLQVDWSRNRCLKPLIRDRCFI